MSKLTKITFARVFVLFTVLCPAVCWGQTAGLSDKARISVFQQAIKAAEANRLTDAERDLRKLLRHYPDSVAVLNNLAVVLMKKGDSDEAIALLNRALKSNRDIFTTYRNLTAIYEQKAALAYQNALDVRTKTPPQADLHLIRQIGTLTQARALADRAHHAQTSGAPSKPLSDNGLTAAPSLSAVRPVIEDDDVNKPYVVDPDSETDNDDTPAADTDRGNRADKGGKKVSGYTKPGHTDKDNDARRPSPQTQTLAAKKETDIIDALERWANAWSDQDVTTYYASYIDGHAPENMTHEEWKKWREERLTTPQFIEVTLEKPSIKEIREGTVQTEFVQYYHSDLLSSTTLKRLLLTQESDHWKILSEMTLRRIR